MMISILPLRKTKAKEGEITYSLDPYPSGLRLPILAATHTGITIH